MVTRADRFGQSQKKVELYSDFLNNIDRHPITNSLARVVNEDSIRQSLKNLIRTNRGERPFEPTVGSDIYKTLFEFDDVITSENIKQYIKQTVKYNESRVRLIDVIVESAADSNEFDVTLLYYIINSTTPSSLSVILKKVR